MPGEPVTQSTRGAILDAALELFSARGYEATTIEDVREQSGASTGSIYHHFGSKQALAAALFLDGLAAFQQQAIEVYEQHPGAEDGVRAIVHLYLRWAVENPRLARFMLTAREPAVRAATDPELAALNRRFFEVSTGWGDRNIDAGQLRPLSPELFRAIVIGPAEAFTRRWLAGRFDSPVDDAAAELADAAWRAVRPAAPA
ncbi:MAG: TetR/AcrR family transcriptional regulator [Chloroflexi bacterium]|nr:TetR/AcrR family transcriptional regulator [Chloroflexota bacterium]MDA1147242.1 TetR/AcrR family transcriptional regulator [Chloroflexota bacterium]